MENHWQGKNSIFPITYLCRQTPWHDISSWHNVYSDVSGSTWFLAQYTVYAEITVRWTVPALS
jgi:hypothetical protein